jgi:hypothetical protein
MIQCNFYFKSRMYFHDKTLRQAYLYYNKWVYLHCINAE